MKKYEELKEEQGVKDGSTTDLHSDFRPDSDTDMCNDMEKKIDKN